MTEIPDYSTLERLIKKFDLLVGDLFDSSSWGKYEGRVVCINYGCDEQTRKEYDDFLLRDK